MATEKETVRKGGCPMELINWEKLDAYERENCKENNLEADRSNAYFAYVGADMRQASILGSRRAMVAFDW